MVLFVRSLRVSGCLKKIILHHLMGFPTRKAWLRLSDKFNNEVPRVAPPGTMIEMSLTYEEVDAIGTALQPEGVRGTTPDQVWSDLGGRRPAFSGAEIFVEPLRELHDAF